MKKFILILSILFLASPAAFAELNFVQRVIDANTLQLISGEKVRLTGLNIKEGKEKQAEEFIRRLVSGMVVDLEYDTQQRDEEGNLLAYIWFEFEVSRNLENLALLDKYDVHYVKSKNGEDGLYIQLNSTAIKAGYALPDFTSQNIKHKELFSQVFEEQRLSADIASVKF